MIKHCGCEEHYAWDMYLWVWQWLCHLEVLNRLQVHGKSVDDPVVTCDEVIDNSETFWINPNDFTSYWLIAVVLVAMTYLLLLIVIAPQYTWNVY